MTDTKRKMKNKYTKCKNCKTVGNWKEFVCCEERKDNKNPVKFTHRVGDIVEK